MKIDAKYLRRCIATLELGLREIGKHDKSEGLIYDFFRSACVKEFELILEHGGQLLQKRLAAFFASNRQANRLTFKNLFRQAAKHGLMEPDAAERWLQYRDHRNDTAHDYGRNFAESTLRMLPAFIADAKALADVVEGRDDG